MANSVINSLEFGENKYVFTLPFGTCSTAAATVAKAVTVDNFSLENGTRILIKFTVNNSAANPTLNVNETGAHPMNYRGAAIGTSYLKADRIYEFVYNATDECYEFIGDIDTNTDTKTFTITAAATDDDVVILTGTNGSNKVTYDAKHAQKGPSAGYTSGNTTTSISGSGGSGTIKVPQITVDKYGHVTAAADENVTITLPTIPTISNSTSTNTGTVKPDASTKQATFKAFSAVGASGHTVSDTETTYTVDLSNFATLNELSTAMVFKGTLGTNGTITTLPTAAASLVGDTYKVITAGTYANIAAQVGDVFVCSATPEWVLIPSGDEPKGTVTSIKAGDELTGGTITTSGTIAHKTSGVTAGSYGPTGNASPAHNGTFTVPQVTVNAYGHITGVVNRTITLPADQDTHWSSKNIVGASGGTGNSAITGNGVYLNHLEGSSVTSTHKISGSGLTSVTSDASGNITINSTVTSSAIETALGYRPSDPTHTHNVTAAGTISTPSFTGTQATISATYTPAGSVSQPTFTGTETATEASTAATSVAKADHTHGYTPAGTVSKPSFTGSEVTSGAAAGSTTVLTSLNKGSLPTFTASVANKCLTFDFSAGALPSASSTTVASNSHTHKVTAAGSVSQPTFTGTAATIGSVSGTVSVAANAHTHKFTAAGTVSKPTFTGTQATISTTYTPAGKVSKPTFTGSQVTTSGTNEPA